MAQRRDRVQALGIEPPDHGQLARSAAGSRRAGQRDAGQAVSARTWSTVTPGCTLATISRVTG